jgi:proteasome lid subunit RPN8/RPN11
MKTLCNQAFPKAEDIRETLKLKFEKEHQEYLNHLTEVANQNKGEEIGTHNSQASNHDQESRRSGTEGEATWKLDPNWQHNKGGQGQVMEMEIPSAPSAPYADIILERLPGQLPAEHLPAFDRNSKPSRFMSPMDSGLREVIVPGDLIDVFLKCAEKNTDNNIETCGFLTGRILGGRLVITDLIIPKQDGTSDSCTAKGDEEYLLIQDNLDLITFGWIHTHPSQTAFLSSVDMHSQFCYQQMMPEALAIVCAPRKNQ